MGTGNLDQSEQRAIPAISSITDPNLDLARFITGFSWVADGISGTAAATIEKFADISAVTAPLGIALTELECFKGFEVPIRKTELWLQSFLELAPFPEVPTQIVSLPWVVEGHTSNRRVVQRNPALIAQRF